MEVQVVNSENVPEGCLLSLSAGGSRRQAPLIPRQKFAFSGSSAAAAVAAGGSGLKVDVLSVQGSARLASSELTPALIAGMDTQGASGGVHRIEVPFNPQAAGPSNSNPEAPMRVGLTIRAVPQGGGTWETSRLLASGLGSARGSEDTSSSKEQDSSSIVSSVQTSGTSLAAQLKPPLLPAAAKTIPGPTHHGTPRSSRRHHVALEARSYLEEHSILPFVERMLRTLVQDRPVDPWGTIRTMLPEGMPPPVDCQDIACAQAKLASAGPVVNQTWRVLPSVGTWYLGRPTARFVAALARVAEATAAISEEPAAEAQAVAKELEEEVKPELVEATAQWQDELDAGTDSRLEEPAAEALQEATQSTDAVTPPVLEEKPEVETPAQTQVPGARTAAAAADVALQVPGKSSLLAGLGRQKTEVQGVTAVEFVIERLDYDVVLSSPDLCAGLLRQLQEVIARKANVHPLRVEVDVGRGSVVVCAAIRCPTLLLAEEAKALLDAGSSDLLEAAERQVLLVPGIQEAITPGSGLQMSRYSSSVKAKLVPPEDWSQRQATSSTIAPDPSDPMLRTLSTTVPSAGNSFVAQSTASRWPLSGMTEDTPSGTLEVSSGESSGREVHILSSALAPQREEVEPAQEDHTIVTGETAVPPEAETDLAEPPQTLEESKQDASGKLNVPGDQALSDVVRPLSSNLMQASLDGRLSGILADLRQEMPEGEASESKDEADQVNEEAHLRQTVGSKLMEATMDGSMSQIIQDMRKEADSQAPAAGGTVIADAVEEVPAAPEPALDQASPPEAPAPCMPAIETSPPETEQPQAEGPPEVPPSEPPAEMSASATTEGELLKAPAPDLPPAAPISQKPLEDAASIGALKAPAPDVPPAAPVSQKPLHSAANIEVLKEHPLTEPPAGQLGALAEEDERVTTPEAPTPTSEVPPEAVEEAARDKGFALVTEAVEKVQGGTVLSDEVEVLQAPVNEPSLIVESLVDDNGTEVMDEHAVAKPQLMDAPHRPRSLNWPEDITPEDERIVAAKLLQHCVPQVRLSSVTSTGTSPMLSGVVSRAPTTLNSSREPTVVDTARGVFAGPPQPPAREPSIVESVPNLPQYQPAQAWPGTEAGNESTKAAPLEGTPPAQAAPLEGTPPAQARAAFEEKAPVLSEEATNVQEAEVVQAKVDQQRPEGTPPKEIAQTLTMQCMPKVFLESLGPSASTSPMTSAPTSMRTANVQPWKIVGAAAQEATVESSIVSVVSSARTAGAAPAGDTNVGEKSQESAMSVGPVVSSLDFKQLEADNGRASGGEVRNSALHAPVKAEDPAVAAAVRTAADGEELVYTPSAEAKSTQGTFEVESQEDEGQQRSPADTQDAAAPAAPAAAEKAGAQPSTAAGSTEDAVAADIVERAADEAVLADAAESSVAIEEVKEPAGPQEDASTMPEVEAMLNLGKKEATEAESHYSCSDASPQSSARGFVDTITATALKAQRRPSSRATPSLISSAAVPEEPEVPAKVPHIDEHGVGAYADSQKALSQEVQPEPPARSEGGDGAAAPEDTVAEAQKEVQPEPPAKSEAVDAAAPPAAAADACAEAQKDMQQEPPAIKKGGDAAVEAVAEAHKEIPPETPTRNEGGDAAAAAAADAAAEAQKAALRPTSRDTEAHTSLTHVSVSSGQGGSETAVAAAVAERAAGVAVLAEAAESAIEEAQSFAGSSPQSSARGFIDSLTAGALAAQRQSSRRPSGSIISAASSMLNECGDIALRSPVAGTVVAEEISMEDLADVLAKASPRQEVPAVKSEADVQPIEAQVAEELGDVTFRLEGLDYAELHADPALLAAFEKKVRQAIAEIAGQGVLPDNVELVLSSGSVIVAARIKAPPAKVQSREQIPLALANTQSLLEKVLQEVSSIDGINKVCKGPLGASKLDAKAPVVLCKDPAAPQPGAQPKAVPEAPAASHIEESPEVVSATDGMSTRRSSGEDFGVGAQLSTKPSGTASLASHVTKAAEVPGVEELLPDPAPEAPPLVDDDVAVTRNSVRTGTQEAEAAWLAGGVIADAVKLAEHARRSDVEDSQSRPISRETEVVTRPTSRGNEHDYLTPPLQRVTPGGRLESIFGDSSFAPSVVPAEADGAVPEEPADKVPQQEADGAVPEEPADKVPQQEADGAAPPEPADVALQQEALPPPGPTPTPSASLAQISVSGTVEAEEAFADLAFATTDQVCQSAQEVAPETPRVADSADLLEATAAAGAVESAADEAVAEATAAVGAVEIALDEAEVAEAVGAIVESAADEAAVMADAAESSTCLEEASAAAGALESATDKGVVVEATETSARPEEALPELHIRPASEAESMGMSDASASTQSSARGLMDAITATALTDQRRPSVPTPSMISAVSEVAADKAVPPEPESAATEGVKAGPEPAAETARTEPIDEAPQPLAKDPAAEKAAEVEVQAAPEPAPAETARTEPIDEAPQPLAEDPAAEKAAEVEAQAAPEPPPAETVRTEPIAEAPQPLATDLAAEKADEVEVKAAPEPAKAETARAETIDEAPRPLADNPAAEKAAEAEVPPESTLVETTHAAPIDEAPQPLAKDPAAQKAADVEEQPEPEFALDATSLAESCVDGDTDASPQSSARGILDGITAGALTAQRAPSRPTPSVLTEVSEADTLTRVDTADTHGVVAPPAAGPAEAAPPAQTEKQTTPPTAPDTPAAQAEPEAEEDRTTDVGEGATQAVPAAGEVTQPVEQISAPAVAAETAAEDAEALPEFALEPVAEEEAESLAVSHTEASPQSSARGFVDTLTAGALTAQRRPTSTAMSTISVQLEPLNVEGANLTADALAAQQAAQSGATSAVLSEASQHEEEPAELTKGEFEPTAQAATLGAPAESLPEPVGTTQEPVELTKGVPDPAPQATTPGVPAESLPEPDTQDTCSAEAAASPQIAATAAVAAGAAADVLPEPPVAEAATRACSVVSEALLESQATEEAAQEWSAALLKDAVEEVEAKPVPAHPQPTAEEVVLPELAVPASTVAESAVDGQTEGSRQSSARGYVDVLTGGALQHNRTSASRATPSLISASSTLQDPSAQPTSADDALPAPAAPSAPEGETEDPSAQPTSADDALPAPAAPPVPEGETEDLATSADNGATTRAAPPVPEPVLEEPAALPAPADNATMTPAAPPIPEPATQELAALPPPEGDATKTPAALAAPEPLTKDENTSPLEDEQVALPAFPLTAASEVDSLVNDQSEVSPTSSARGFVDTLTAGALAGQRSVSRGTISLISAASGQSGLAEEPSGEQEKPPADAGASEVLASSGPIESEAPPVAPLGVLEEEVAEDDVNVALQPCVPYDVDQAQSEASLAAHALAGLAAQEAAAAQEKTEAKSESEPFSASSSRAVKPSEFEASAILPAAGSKADSELDQTSAVSSAVADTTKAHAFAASLKSESARADSDLEQSSAASSVAADTLKATTQLPAIDEQSDCPAETCVMSMAEAQEAAAEAVAEAAVQQSLLPDENEQNHSTVEVAANKASTDLPLLPLGQLGEERHEKTEPGTPRKATAALPTLPLGRLAERQEKTEPSTPRKVTPLDEQAAAQPQSAHAPTEGDVDQTSVAASGGQETAAGLVGEIAEVVPQPQSSLAPSEGDADQTSVAASGGQTTVAGLVGEIAEAAPEAQSAPAPSEGDADQTSVAVSGGQITVAGLVGEIAEAAPQEQTVPAPSEDADQTSVAASGGQTTAVGLVGEIAEAAPREQTAPAPSEDAGQTSVADSCGHLTAAGLVGEIAEAAPQAQSVPAPSDDADQVSVAASGGQSTAAGFVSEMAKVAPQAQSAPAPSEGDLDLVSVAASGEQAAAAGLIGEMAEASNGDAKSDYLLEQASLASAVVVKMPSEVPGAEASQVGVEEGSTVTSPSKAPTLRVDLDSLKSDPLEVPRLPQHASAAVQDMLAKNWSERNQGLLQEGSSTSSTAREAEAAFSDVSIRRMVKAASSVGEDDIAPSSARQLALASEYARRAEEQAIAEEEDNGRPGTAGSRLGELPPKGVLESTFTEVPATEVLSTHDSSVHDLAADDHGKAVPTQEEAQPPPAADDPGPRPAVESLDVAGDLEKTELLVLQRAADPSEDGVQLSAGTEATAPVASSLKQVTGSHHASAATQSLATEGLESLGALSVTQEPKVEVPGRTMDSEQLSSIVNEVEEAAKAPFDQTIVVTEAGLETSPTSPTSPEAVSEQPEEATGTAGDAPETGDPANKDLRSGMRLALLKSNQTGLLASTLEAVLGTEGPIPPQDEVPAVPGVAKPGSDHEEAEAAAAAAAAATAKSVQETQPAVVAELAEQAPAVPLAAKLQSDQQAAEAGAAAATKNVQETQPSAVAKPAEQAVFHDANATLSDVPAAEATAPSSDVLLALAEAEAGVDELHMSVTEVDEHSMELAAQAAEVVGSPRDFQAIGTLHEEEEVEDSVSEIPKEPQPMGQSGQAVATASSEPPQPPPGGPPGGPQPESQESEATPPISSVKELEVVCREAVSENEHLRAENESLRLELQQLLALASPLSSPATSTSGGKSGR